MELLKIQGGARLCGTIQAPGSKNAVLALLSAVLLCDDQVTLHNVPDISDVKIKLKLLEGFGVTYEMSEGTAVFNCRGIKHWVPSEEDVRPIRTSFYLFGPLLARNGYAVLPMPGGCKIGTRPVDFHIKGLTEMGAEITIENGCYIGRTDKLKGAEIYLDFPSAGATQHLMTAACLAEGVTTIQNAAMEPEVVQLAEFLVSLGARIEGYGTSTVTIYGQKSIAGGTHNVPADRIQASTFLLAGAITGGDVTVTGIVPEHQVALIKKLHDAEINAEEGFDSVRVWSTGRPVGTRIKTMPYPGFPTDIQQPFAALMAIAKGSSTIEETIYESRIGHVDELNRMGAKMRVQGQTTMIEGVKQLHGAKVTASDLRAGAALVLAGLAAEGETTISNVHFIDRGYEFLEQRIQSLGGTIERVPFLNEKSSGIK